jgi:ATP-dependent DNA helicase RecQ
MYATGADRQRIVAALNFLEEQGDLKLEVAGARQGFRLLKPEADVRELARSMQQRFADRESRDTARLDTVLDFIAQAESCRTAKLLDYFGERLDESASGRCGHCDVCLGESAGPVPQSPPRAITDHERDAIKRVLAERHAALSTPRQLARFLCGLNSPATTKAKLKVHRAFGLLADVPFATVLETLKAAVPHA